MREAARQEAGRQARYRRSAASGTSQAGSKASSGSKASYCQAFSNTDCRAVVYRPAAYRPRTCPGLQLIPGHHVGKMPITTATCYRTRWVSSGMTVVVMGPASAFALRATADRQGRDDEDRFLALG